MMLAAVSLIATEMVEVAVVESMFSQRAYRVLRTDAPPRASIGRTIELLFNFELANARLFYQSAPPDAVNRGGPLKATALRDLGGV